MSTIAPSPPQPVRVVLVEATACHLCEDAKRILDEYVDIGMVHLETVDATTERGASLLRRFRAPMFPLVVVDDTLFSYGRLPRRKLAKLLTQRIPAMSGRS